jgi:large subunit ribosomal protein L25
VTAGLFDEEQKMEQKTLAFSVRGETRKRPAGRLRRTGKIPSIVYGRRDPLPIAIDEHEFGSKFRTVSESTIITLKSDTASMEVLVKDYQEDIVSGRITHIDFYEIDQSRALRTRVAVRLTGSAVGVREGGLLETLVHDLEIECLPKNLPPDVEVDVTDLQIGHSVHVRDLPAMEGVRVVTPGDQVVCTVLVKKAEVVAAPVEGAVEEGVVAPAEGEAAPAAATPSSEG